MHPNDPYENAIAPMTLIQFRYECEAVTTNEHQWAVSLWEYVDHLPGACDPESHWNIMMHLLPWAFDTPGDANSIIRPQLPTYEQNCIDFALHSNQMEEHYRDSEFADYDRWDGHREDMAALIGGEQFEEPTMEEYVEAMREYERGHEPEQINARFQEAAKS